jgi:hypothetical protein
LVKKKAAFLILLLVIAGACYLTSPAISIAPGASFSLFKFLSLFMDSGVALADPVPGCGPGGQD